MSQSIFQVRPQDAGKGWAIDEYDGRGAWQSTYRNNPKGEPMDKQEAQRRVFQLRRKALNSAKTEAPVNKAEVRRGGLYCTHSEALASGFCPDCEQIVNLLPRTDSLGSTETLPKGGRPQYVQQLMRLVCPDDSAVWWEVEDIYEFKGEMCATLRSNDVRRLEQVLCSTIRADWSLYEDFDPAAQERP